MTAVFDASVLVAALTDTGEAGAWAEDLVGSSSIAAPQILPAEVANVLRRLQSAGRLSLPDATSSHRELLTLRCRLFPYHPFAGRVWELRENLTTYDAWYVALAEGIGAPLATLDARLRRAPGPKCDFLTLT
jgi:predicted nucleic acid-binding protein